MGHSEFSAGIGAVAATQFGGGQTYTADTRPLVKKREEEERHRQPHDRFLDDEELDQESQQEDGPEEETTPAEIEPLTASLRGPEQHVGLILDVKL